MEPIVEIIIIIIIILVALHATGFWAIQAWEFQELVAAIVDAFVQGPSKPSIVVITGFEALFLATPSHLVKYLLQGSLVTTIVQVASSGFPCDGRG